MMADDTDSSAGNVAGTDGPSIEAVDNPSLERRCGLDVVLVLDASSSVRNAEVPADGNGAVDLVAGAANAFLGGLAGTNTQVAVVSYNAEPIVQLGLADVTAASLADGGAHAIAIGNPGGVEGPIPNTTGYSEHARVGSGTNWEAGLRRAAEVLADARPGVPRLVVHVTDGRPTRHIDENGETTRDGGLAVHTAEAAEAADELKAAGVHIYSVGVGRAGSGSGSFLAQLEAVSGPDVFDQGDSFDVFDPADDDVILTADFGALEALLGGLANSLCGASLTITKLASTPDAPDTFAPMAEIDFMAAPNARGGFDWLLPDVAPADFKTAVTDDAGRVQFQWDIFDEVTWATGNVLIAEAAQAGFELQPEVRCTRTSTGEEFSVIADPAAGTFTVPVRVGAALACEVRNRAVVDDDPDPPLDPPEMHMCKVMSVETIPPTGAYVNMNIQIFNDSVEPETIFIDSVTDSRYGDLLDPNNPLIIDGYCTSSIEPGGSYGCVYSVFLEGGAPGTVHNDLAQVDASDADGLTAHSEYASSIRVVEGGGVREPCSWARAELPERILIGDWDGDAYCNYRWESCIELSRQEAQTVLSSSSDDARMAMLQSLLATWLNIRVGGNDLVCVEDTTNATVAWLHEHAPEGNPLAGGEPIARGELEAADLSALAAGLDDYNTTGGGCAPVAR
ncbi:vWA domain-containing protein [Haliangium sp.]|uniref:vWA domain-containing protein n=1 Tax=Haliangium sp. TaxID=2663208 RepID=UPI003D11F80F